MRRTLNALAVLLVFAFFFNGTMSKGPSRQKFKVLESGEENLIKAEAPPEVNRLKEISKDRRLTEWAAWWQKCAPNFSLDAMENLGEFPIDNQPVDVAKWGEPRNGPAKSFYVNSPDGKHAVNPYFGRLVYKMEADSWQPYVELGCGAELYDASTKRSSIILQCFMHDGLENAFWLNKDRLVIVGYEAVTRQMNVECETVESCASPSVWIIDIKSGTMNEHRGPIVKRSLCDLTGYLKLTRKDFFGKK